jgi:hypothetical protein
MPLSNGRGRALSDAQSSTTSFSNPTVLFGRYEGSNSTYPIPLVCSGTLYWLLYVEQVLPHQ